MMVLVCYDVSQDDKGKRRLRKVAKLLEDYGQRVQCSVFECLIQPDEWVVLKYKLIHTINIKYDSLRCYHLGANWVRRVEEFGVKKTFDPQGLLLF